MNRRTYLRFAAGSTTLALVPGTVPGSRAGLASTTDESGSRQGEAAVDLSVHEVEDGEHVTYLESEDVVEYAAVMSGDEVVKYRSTDWEDWAQQRCTESAATRAREYLDDELPVDVGGGITNRVDGESFAAFVSVVDEDEEWTLEDLASQTPATVAASYELGEQAYEMDVPIYVERRTETETMEGDMAGADGVHEGSDDGNGNNGSGTNGGDDPGQGETDEQDSDDEDDTADDTGDDGFGPGFGIGSAIAVLAGGWYVARRGSGGTDE